MYSPSPEMFKASPTQEMLERLPDDVASELDAVRQALMKMGRDSLVFEEPVVNHDAMDV